jgi:drug/metabolite transporter (DMT)-like permease
MRRLFEFRSIGISPRELQAIGGALFAVVLWGALPLIRELGSAVPPLQTTAIALICAALVETARIAMLRPNVGHGVRGAPLGWRDGAVLSLSLIGAIAFYFLGLARAPAAQVTLITYLWPLLFVAASELQTRGRLRPVVMIGAAVACGGAGLLVARDLHAGLSLDHALGYLAGVASGVCWVVYSITLRTRRDLGQEAFPKLFAAGAVLAAALHLAVEPTVWPLSPTALAVCALIGAGPYGLAFIAWAHGLRHGPPQVVGALAYAVPVITAVLLVAVGMAEPTWHMLVGGTAVVLGVVLGNLGRSGRAT